MVLTQGWRDEPESFGPLGGENFGAVHGLTNLAESRVVYILQDWQTFKSKFLPIKTLILKRYYCLNLNPCNFGNTLSHIS